MIKCLFTYISFLVSFFIGANLHAQNDSILIESYLNKASDFEQTNIDSASWYTDKAYEMARATNNLYLKTRTSIASAMQSQYLTDYKTFKLLI